MKKKAAFLLAFVMLASVPYSGALASDADVIISEDIAEDEVTDTSDLDFSEISVEEVEEIPAEAEAVTETEASGQTGEAETETVAETEAETSGEAVEPTTESAASAESETISEEASAELSTEVSLEADAAAEPEGTAETETSQTVSDESGSLSDDGIMVSSIEEVESVAETETDVQTVATTTVTELETNTIYSLADVIGSTQYFSVPSAGRMQIIIANSVNTSYTLYVYNTGLLSNYRKLSYETGIESVTFDYVVLPEAKQYSFEISGSTPNSEATLEIRFEAAGTYNGETEWNDSFDTANEIALNTAYFGTVSSDDKYDYYHFTLTSPSRVSFSDGSDESHYVTLYSEDSNGNTTRLYGNLTNWRLPAGSYFVVIGYNSGYRPYYLTVSATAESADAYEIEKNDLTSQANSKKTSTWDTGNINYYSSSDSGLCDVDWFSYSVTEKCYLTLELKVPRQSSGTVTATLYLLSGKELVEVAAITSGSDPYISSEKLFCKAGTYYVKVTGNSSSATWDYSVCLTKAKYTALTKLTLPTTKYIKVGATANLNPSYTPSDASEKGVTWTSSNMNVATVDENGKVTALTSGKTTITVTSSFSDSSSVKAKCTLYVQKPVSLSLSSAENTSSGIKLTWKKVSGASGYYVYRKTSSGKYGSTPIKTIKSGSTTSYTDTSIKSKNGTTYIYKVVPYSDYIAGTGTGKKITRLTGTSLSSLKSSDVGELTVKWKTASSVSGYQIQYSTSSKFSSGNKTKLVSGKSKTSCTLSGLTADKTYYVRIRTYKTVSGKKYYSAWSSASSKKIANLKATYSYSTKDQSKTYGNVKAKVYYKRVVLKGSSSAIKKINSSIKSDMDSFLKSSSKADLYDYAKSWGGEGYKDTYYYTATSEVTYNNNGVISIKVTTKWYAGGVHNTNVYGLTYDLKTGKKLNLVNVCPGDSDTVKDSVLEKAQSTWISSDGLPVLKAYSAKKMNFYLKSGNKAVVCFEPYELFQGGSYASYVIKSSYK